jgi:hypothetical protein
LVLRLGAQIIDAGVLKILLGRVVGTRRPVMLELAFEVAQNMLLFWVVRVFNVWQVTSDRAAPFGDVFCPVRCGQVTSGRRDGW